jgi:hypothetical protein
MSAVLGIGIGSRGAIAIMTVEGGLIDALDMPGLNDGPAGRRTGARRGSDAVMTRLKSQPTKGLQHE